MPRPRALPRGRIAPTGRAMATLADRRRLPVLAILSAHPRPRRSAATAGAVSGLTHIAGVAERVAAGLRPHRQPVRLVPDRDRRHRAAFGVDRIDDIVVA